MNQNDMRPRPNGRAGGATANANANTNANADANANKAAAVKGPAPEDLSRWENEGGSTSEGRGAGRARARSYGKDDLFQRTLDRILGSGPGLERVRARIEEEVRERPLIAVGVATAIGFMLAGGFRTRSGRKMIKRAIRYGMLRYVPGA
jgi:hypothetical protein